MWLSLDISCEWCLSRENSRERGVVFVCVFVVYVDVGVESEGNLMMLIVGIC